MWGRRIRPIETSYDLKVIMLMLAEMDEKLDRLLALEEDDDDEP